MASYNKINESFNKKFKKLLEEDATNLTMPNEAVDTKPRTYEIKIYPYANDLSSLARQVIKIISDVGNDEYLTMDALSSFARIINGFVNKYKRKYNESLKEAFDINSMSRSKLIDAIDEFYREDALNSYIIDDKTIEDILTENGADEDDSDPYEGFYSSMSNEQLKNVFQIVRNYLKAQDENYYDSDIFSMFKLKRAWIDESLKEGYGTYTVGELRDLLDNALYNIEDYEDSDEVKLQPNTYGLSSYISIPSKGFIDLYDIMSENEDY